MKKNKKGFTIVELVIVIAIIAILAAVLIPVFTSMIHKAQVSDDTMLVKNLNTALELERPFQEDKNMKYDHPYEAIQACENYGYKVDTIEKKSEYGIAFNMKIQGFVLLDIKDNGDGKAIYPTASGTTELDAKPENKHDFFLFRNSMPKEGDKEYGYSVYANRNGDFDDPVVNVNGFGFDAGIHKEIEEVNYVNTIPVNGELMEKTIVIRTSELNGGTTDVNQKAYVNEVTGACDNVTIVNGSLDNVESGNHSTHVKGKFSYLEITKGNVVFEKGCSIDTLFLNATANKEKPFEDITLTICDGAYIKALHYTGEENPDEDVEETVKEKMIDRSTFSIGDGTLICKVQNATEDGKVDEENAKYIWFFGNGVFDETIPTGDIVLSDSNEKEHAREEGQTLDEAKDSGTDVSIIAIKIAESFFKNDDGDYTDEEGNVIVEKAEAEANPTSALETINEKIEEKIEEQVKVVENANGDLVYEKDPDVIVVSKEEKEADPDSVEEKVQQAKEEKKKEVKETVKESYVTSSGKTTEQKEQAKEKAKIEAKEEANKAIAECIVGSASMDFADAIAMAQDNVPIEIKINKTIYIKGNDGITIPAKKDITIDLNGWEIVGQFDEKRDGNVFNNKGTLTIKDSSAEQNGKITDTGLTLDEAGNWHTDPKRNYADNVFSNYGTLTLESGTIEQGINGNIVYCVDNYSGATFNMTGGHLYNYNTAAVRMFCNSTTVDNVVNISGGLIEGYQDIWVQNPSGTKTVGGLKDKGHLNISGGTFDVLGSGTDAIYSYEAYYGASPDGYGNYYDCSEIYVNITGGVFNSKIHIYKCSDDSSKNVNLAISGGSFIANTQKTSNESYISLGGGYYYYEPSSDRWVYYYFGDDTYKAGWYYYSGDFIADCAAIGYTVSADQDYMYVTPSKVEGMIAGATVNLENGYLVVSMEN